MTTLEIVLDAIQDDGTESVLNTRLRTGAGALHHILKVVDLPRTEFQRARARPASANIVQLGAVDRQVAHIVQPGRIGESPDGVDDPALLEVRDSPHPCD